MAVKPRTSNPISARDRAAGARRVSSVVEGKPRHDFSACIACAACAAACDANAIRIFIDEDEGLLVWTLDLFDCTHCGRCVPVCPTGAMDVIEGADFADEPELPKRCLFTLAECESCGRYYATNKEIAFANALLEQDEHADAARALALTGICPDCKRLHDAKAAGRRAGMRRLA
ncbi:4Fe-4S dicluster domain-containing protein [Arabiibacter massiliensis]|uniref:4Fe-4S dicluster domain-containing protein n=1 Tax=Arabiibacter massiliensis TaxID=1870985 RepID=UPI0009B95721|nr:4Fe-4S dicluster domain-containing protein [Arabiibacter massiliensis]